MKRVLILAYYFPPLGGVGVHRAVKFAKYLRDFGYEATIVTGPDTGSVDWAPTDQSLSRDVPSDLRVLRLGSAAVPSPGEVHRLRRWLALRMPFERWWEQEATRLGHTVVAETDLVFATMSPFGTAAAAAAIVAESRTPWVADLQDPWALDDWTVYPTMVHRALDRHRMARALSGAAAVIMNTGEAAHALQAEIPSLASSRVLTIPQGWDREDFSRPLTTPQGAGLRVVYAGYSHVQRGKRHQSRRILRTLSGGAVKGMDILPRSHVFLLSALEKLHDLDPGLGKRIELHIAGPAAIDLSETTVSIHRHGYLPHDQAVALMRTADVLFLPMHDLPAGVRTRTVPGKTYEYLASGRPILAALPDGDARDLVAGQPNVWLCRPRDVEGMTTALGEILRAAKPPSPKCGLIEPYEWHQLTGRVAALFDEILETAPGR